MRLSLKKPYEMLKTQEIQVHSSNLFKLFSMTILSIRLFWYDCFEMKKKKIFFLTYRFLLLNVFNYKMYKRQYLNRKIVLLFNVDNFGFTDKMLHFIKCLHA